MKRSSTPVLALAAIAAVACAPEAGRAPVVSGAAPSAAIPSLPRSAVALRSAAFFKAICLDVGAARAREIAGGGGPRRAEGAEARAFLGDRTGEVWINEGRDTLVLTLTTAPTARCELGIRGLGYEDAADALHLVLAAADRSAARLPPRRDPAARATYRLTGGDGRPRLVEAVRQTNPGNVIRVVLVSEEVAASR